MEGVAVREASPGDVGAVLALLGELGRPEPAGRVQAEAFAGVLKGYIADDDKRIFVALVDGEVAGMASALLLPRLNRDSPELYVPELVVGRRHRGRGAGGALMERCAELAAERGCHRMRLESGNRRVSSHRFYRNLGFEQSALSFSRDAG